jgi:hypothetical protein
MSLARVAVFSATNGTYDIQEIPTGAPQVMMLQRLVGGYFACLPHHKAPDEQPFVAYANENGFDQRLPRNWTAWGVLMQLGFQDTGVDGAFFGDVVVMGPNEESLSDAKLEELKAAHARYVKELECDD